jgi:hypothetical protein
MAAMAARRAVTLGAAALAACALALPAGAKLGFTIRAADATPARGQVVTVTVRSERPLDFDLRLIAVAPGQPVFRVVATITGDTGRPIANVRSRGFEVPLVRRGPDRWRGETRFDRRGRWLLVVPNGAPTGVIIPNGAASLALRVR